jgi:hypothetical protein
MEITSMQIRMKSTNNVVEKPGKLYKKNVVIRANVNTKLVNILKYRLVDFMLFVKTVPINMGNTDRK